MAFVAMVVLAGFVVILVAMLVAEVRWPSR